MLEKLWGKGLKGNNKYRNNIYFIIYRNNLKYTLVFKRENAKYILYLFIKNTKHTSHFS